MQRWLKDGGRFLGALFYWNARKTAFVLRRRRGQCPCHHPSDTGRAGETVCEGAAAWHDPRRFRRVCPLLTQDAAGRWVCGVDAAQVRPFWGRVLVFSGGVLLLVALLSGVAVWGTMRGIGYQVTVRQVFWPPAWRELRTAQARLFVDRAQVALAAGRSRDAVAALLQAQQLDPANFEAGFTLAHLSQATNPTWAWRLYQTVARAHPQRRHEVAQAAAGMWVAHGRWAELAALATTELANHAPGEGAWLHALGVAARLQQRVDWLERAAQTAARPEVRATLGLMSRVLRTPGAPERHHLLTETAPAPGCAYERIFRVEELIRLDAAEEALALIREGGANGLPGRDVARLSLAAHARRGDKAWVRAQAAALLRPGRELRAPELELLALHLLKWPDQDQLAALVAALDRIGSSPAAEQLKACVAVYVVAALQDADDPLQASALGHLRGLLGMRSVTLNRLTENFRSGKTQKKLDTSVLCELPVVPLELLYGLKEYPG